jgi:hypothetical protein
MRVSETRRPFATAGRTVFGLGRMAHATRQPCARHSSSRRKTTPRAGRLVRTSLERARTFAFIRDTYVIVRAGERNLAAIRALGYRTSSVNVPQDFPPGDSGYHNFAEIVADISATAAASDLYITDGTSIDWMYGAHRIFAFTIEVYPKCCDFYVPDEVIQQTDRLNGAVMYLLDHSDCPYEVIGQPCS